MKLYIDFDIEEFEAWSGGADTKQAIIEAGKADLFNVLVDDIFPDGCTDTAMNDFLWFDSASIYEMLGLNEDGEEPEDEPEELESIDFSLYDEFLNFCDDHGCASCPFEKVCGTQEDCRAKFDELKGVYEA